MNFIDGYNFIPLFLLFFSFDIFRLMAKYYLIMTNNSFEGLFLIIDIQQSLRQSHSDKFIFLINISD